MTTLSATHVPEAATTAEFEEFAREQWEPAVRHAMRLTRNRDDAEDVVAEAMANLWRRWHKTDIANPGGYLRRSLSNGIIDRLRRAAREQAALARLGTRVGFHEDATGEDWDTLIHALAQLSHREQQVLALRFLLDLSHRDAAAYLHVPVGTTKSHASRGLRRLRAAYLPKAACTQ